MCKVNIVETSKRCLTVSKRCLTVMIRLSAVSLWFVSINACFIKDWDEARNSGITCLKNVSSGLERRAYQQFFYSWDPLVMEGRPLRNSSNVRIQVSEHMKPVHYLIHLLLWWTETFERELALFFIHLQVIPEKLKWWPSLTSYNSKK